MVKKFIEVRCNFLGCFDWPYLNSEETLHSLFGLFPIRAFDSFGGKVSSNSMFELLEKQTQEDFEERGARERRRKKEETGIQIQEDGEKRNGTRKKLPSNCSSFIGSCDLKNCSAAETSGFFCFQKHKSPSSISFSGTFGWKF